MTDDVTARLDAHGAGIENLWTTIDTLQEENQKLRDRITELERIVDPANTIESYDQLTREQKAFKLRVALTRKALESNGRAAMKYAEVKAVFGNHPSPGHTYDLMEIAAEADGFTYSDATGEKRLTVKTGGVNDDAVIRTANKTGSAVPA